MALRPYSAQISSIRRQLSLFEPDITLERQSKAVSSLTNRYENRTGMYNINSIQGRSENSHYFGLFNIILSQISPEIISIIRDASQLSRIMTKPSRIRFFFEKWLFLVKLHPIKKISCYLLIWPEVRKWSIFELHCDRLPHIESSNGIDVY